MFLTSFIILASLRLTYRCGLWPAVLSLLLSLWALRDSFVPHHTDFTSWLASAAWTITLIGAARRHRPWFTLILLCQTGPVSSPAPPLACHFPKDQHKNQPTSSASPELDM